MDTLLRCIKADFYKLRHTPIVWLHIAIPLFGAVSFLLYYTVSSWDTVSKINGYLDALAIAFPFLIGLMSGMVVSEEEQAGNFQVLLSSINSKSISYLSKLLLLLLMGGFSVMLAVGTFAVVFKAESPVFYLEEGLVLIMSSIFIYILHLYISLQFGKGASIGLGIAGSLVSCLLQTGLGDRIWQWIPWSWGVRFSEYIILKKVKPSAFTAFSTEFYYGVWVMMLVTLLSIILSLFWFKSWEGRKCQE